MTKQEVKKGDFIEIEYVGRLKENGKIFDLTKESVAREEGIYQESTKYKPVILCIGHKEVVSGLDHALAGKFVDEEFNVEVQPEDAFGKKRTDLIKLVPLSFFSQKGVRPVPGIQFSFDGLVGMVRSVSGGRVLVDFNHPLSGKVLIYEVKIIKKIEGTKEKLEGFLGNLMGDKFEVEIKDGHAIVKADIPAKIDKKLAEEVKMRIPEIKLIEFKPKEEQKGIKGTTEIHSSQK